MLSGLKVWHDPATWPSGVVPSVAGAAVTLPANTAVLITSCSIPADLVFGLISIPATSSLVLADADISLQATGIDVAGALIAGSESCRLRSNITITLHGRRPTPGVMMTSNATDKGIVVSGTGRLDLHGALYSDTWSRLASQAWVGDTWIFLQTLVNREAGQEIVVMTTTLKDSRDYTENEVRRVRRVLRVWPGSPITAVELDAPLTRNHYAGQEYQAEVALLSRRLRVQGDPVNSEPMDNTPVACSDSTFTSYPCENRFLTGYGGHIMVMGASAAGRLSGVQLYRMGQTNALGRYAMHWHLVGEGGANSFMQDSSVVRSFFRCASIHATNATRLSRNVGYDVIGHCWYLEDGVEERNLIEYNIGAHIHSIAVKPPSNALSSGQFFPVDWPMNMANLQLPADITAAAFYITNAYNRFIGNAGVGCVRTAR